MQKATLCFLIKGNPLEQILMGYKKAGFGAGKFGGFGGKVEPGETVVQAAIRELEEETSVRVREEHLHLVGHLTFTFPFKPGWNQVVYVFLADRWLGDPVESDEMVPTWFPPEEIPYQQMWQDGPHWLPPILAGEQIRARYTFQEDNETVDEVEMEEWGAS